MLASILDQLASLGVVIGLAVVALVLLGLVRLGGSSSAGGETDRQRRGRAYLQGTGDDDGDAHDD